MGAMLVEVRRRGARHSIRRRRRVRVASIAEAARHPGERKHRHEAKYGQGSNKGVHSGVSEFGAKMVAATAAGPLRKPLFSRDLSTDYTDAEAGVLVIRDIRVIRG